MTALKCLWDFGVPHIHEVNLEHTQLQSSEIVDDTLSADIPYQEQWTEFYWAESNYKCAKHVIVKILQLFFAFNNSIFYCYIQIIKQLLMLLFRMYVLLNSICPRTIMPNNFSFSSPRNFWRMWLALLL